MGSETPASQDLWPVALPGERGLLDTPRDGAHYSTEIQNGSQVAAPKGPRRQLATPGSSQTALPPPCEARLCPATSAQSFPSTVEAAPLGHSTPASGLQVR